MMITKNTPNETLLSMAPPCTCSKCSHGCKFGSGYLFENEAGKIAEHLKITLDNFKKEYLDEIEIFNTKAYRFKLLKKNAFPYGKCVFFRDSLCSIHEVKPLHCKISTGCKSHGEDASLWFMLNNFVNVNDAESIRQYASYLKLGGKTIGGGNLNEIIPDQAKLDRILNRREA